MESWPASVARPSHKNTVLQLFFTLYNIVFTSNITEQTDLEKPHTDKLIIIRLHCDSAWM